ncbi:MAG TPA: rod shape-determining protein MreC [Deltaproteobacteria bacterium]|nr:rod shape-determining protein MreC [Deltaproteobacteria bacterium]
MLSFIRRHQIILSAFLLCLISLHIAVNAERGIGGEVIVRGVVSTISKPFQKGFLALYSVFDRVWSNYVYLVGVKEENRALKESLHKLLEENNRLREELLLTARLKEILKYRARLGIESVAAEVIGYSSFGAAGWIKTATLDKGSRDGIKVDMAVVSPRGVVGRIIEVTATTSTVLLITDPRSSIDAVVQRTRIKGLLEGTGSRTLRLKYIRQLDDVKPGDVLVTAGLSGIFPKGLALGRITRVEKGKDNFFKYIEAEPMAPLDNLEEVLIIKKSSRG